MQRSMRAEADRPGIGTPVVAVGQIATVSAGHDPVTIARQSQQNLCDVKAGIGSSAASDTVTGRVVRAPTCRPCGAMRLQPAVAPASPNPSTDRVAPSRAVMSADGLALGGRAGAARA
jgi:hypothetical protein